MGTKTPAIARLESGGGSVKTFRTVTSRVPREAGVKKHIFSLQLQVG